jgi:monothiol glutaredoxin
MTLSEATRQQISETLQKNEVVLYMKGKRRMPQCGFSAKVVQILDQLVPEYTTVNVLDSAEIREGIKAYSDWPTIPQLYIKGKFVGGADIVTELFNNGELHGLLGQAVPTVSAPKLSATPSARAALQEALQDAPGLAVRLVVDAQFRPALDLDQQKDGDFVVDVEGMRFLIDRGSALRADGVSIDFVGGAQAGFRIENPNEPPRVKQLSPSELKVRLDAKEPLWLIDVRTPDEHQTARIAGAKLLDDGLKDQILGLPKDTTLVFQCHHGQRSQAAAQFFLQQGFRKIYNLAGGIDAWSTQVDPAVPRY